MTGIKKTVFIALAVAAAVMLAASGAMADTRSFVWTYEYGTEPKGGAEIEYYFTALNGGKDSAGTTYQHQVELEYGITDHLDAGLYLMFNREGSLAPDYEGFKLKTRYRFGERGKYFIDPEVYVEYENRTGEKEAAELKLILSKDVGKFSLAYNQIAEITFGRGGTVEHEFAAGITYPVSHAFGLGIETMGSYTEKEYAVGPTIAWHGGKFWANAGLLFGLSNNTAHTQARFLLGIPF